MLLQAAFALLTLVTTTPVPQSIRDQSIIVVNQAIVFANNEIAQSQVASSSDPVFQVPQYIPPIINNTSTPTGSIPIEPLIQPKNMITLEIFSPIPLKGLNREIRTSGINPDTGEMYNEVYIGLICKEDNNPIKDAIINVEATDSTQNKVINGTGNLATITDNLGQKSKVYYYPFTYQIKTIGTHTITFTCNDVSESVNIEVSQ